MMYGEILYCLGEFASAREHCERGQVYCDPRQRRSHLLLYGNDTGTGVRLMRALSLWYLGYPDQAAKEMDELLVLAQELGHPFNLVFVLYFGACVRQLRRETQVARERAATTLHISRERDFALYMAWAMSLHGWTLAMQGRQSADVDRASADVDRASADVDRASADVDRASAEPDQLSAAIGQMEAGIAARRAEGGVSLLTYLLALLAEVYGQAGRTQEALGQIDEALDLAERTGERFWEAELHRLRGEMLLAKKESADPARTLAQAEACFQRALAIARRQRARSWELRAATSLARLQQRQERREEARELLQGVYDWFTEGFDTADLQEAKTLLDTL
jgi:adenylate cyclase